MPVPAIEGQPRRTDRGDGVLGRAAVHQGLDGEHAHGAVDVLFGWDPVSILVQSGVCAKADGFLCEDLHGELR